MTMAASPNEALENMRTSNGSAHDASRLFKDSEHQQNTSFTAIRRANINKSKTGGVVQWVGRGVCCLWYGTGA